MILSTNHDKKLWIRNPSNEKPFYQLKQANSYKSVREPYVKQSYKQNMITKKIWIRIRNTDREMHWKQNKLEQTAIKPMVG